MGALRRVLLHLIVWLFVCAIDLFCSVLFYYVSEYSLNALWECALCVRANNPEWLLWHSGFGICYILYDDQATCLGSELFAEWKWLECTHSWKKIPPWCRRWTEKRGVLKARKWASSVGPNLNARVYNLHTESKKPGKSKGQAVHVAIHSPFPLLPESNQRRLS